MNHHNHYAIPIRFRNFVISGLTCFIITCGFAGEAKAVPEIELEPVVTGLDRPVAITHAGDGSGRLFITLLGGQIVIYDGGQVLAQPFLDIGALVTSGGERGLLSVTFHPDYRANGLLFVDYTDLNGNTVVARYSVSADPNIVNPASAEILLSIVQPYTNHNGGQLQFGPDGYLYISLGDGGAANDSGDGHGLTGNGQNINTVHGSILRIYPLDPAVTADSGMGDGGSGGDPQNHAQTLGDLLGKMLRIDVDGNPPYSIPADNPFINDPVAREEIWALGLRNPWRFSFDRQTGDLFIADVGQSRIEEVNFQPANSTGGENYGWNLMEGSDCYPPSSNCNSATLTLPILEYDHSLGCSITGGYRYRGAANPGLWGVYFYGDYCSGRIWGATEDNAGTWTTEELLDTNLQITAFGEDENGEIYLADFADGGIYRIDEILTEPTSDGGGGGGGCFILIAAE